MLNILDGSESTEKDLRPQSDRERLLESQLTGIIKQLQTRTALAIKEQKKLEEECRRATEELKCYQDQWLVGKGRLSEILLNALHAIDRLTEFRRQPQQEQAALDEYRMAREDVERHSEVQARLAVEIREGRIPMQTMWKFLLASEARESSKREKQLQELLDIIITRKRRWQHDIDVSEKKSISRQGNMASLWRQIGEMLDSVAKAVDTAEPAAQKGLVLAVDRKKICKKELNLSSERLKNIQQQISLLANRRRSLDELESTCGKLRSAPELFRQTSSESHDLEEQLPQVLKNEEHLHGKLQETYEREKEWIKLLKKVFEHVSGVCLRMSRTQESQRMKEVMRVIQKESELQGRMREACERERCFVEVISQITNSDVQLQEEIAKMSQSNPTRLIRSTQKIYEPG